MFIAKASCRMLCILAGIRIPVARPVTAPVGLQHLDREEAIQACEEHYEKYKLRMIDDDEIVNKALITDSYLVWSGLRASLNAPIRLAPLMAAADTPDVLVYDVIYMIHEVDFWDVGRL